MPSLSEIGHGYVVEIIVAILVTATIAFFGRAKEKWSWPTMALYALVSVACVLFIFDRLTQPPRSDVEPVDLRNVESKIKTWLDSFYIGSQRIRDDKSYFNYQLPAATANPPITIARVKDRAQYVTILAHIKLAEDDKAFYGKLSDLSRTEFLMQLRSELAKAKIGYILDFTGGSVDTIVYRQVPITNALTESTFMREIDEVGFAAAIVNDTIELTLLRMGEPMPPSPAPHKATSQPSPTSSAYP